MKCLDLTMSYGESSFDELYMMYDDIAFQDRKLEHDKIAELAQAEIDHAYCNSCKKSQVIKEDHILGLMLCTNCGEVGKAVPDTSPEWNMYNDTNIPKCNGAINIFLPQSSLGTTFGGNSRVKTLHRWVAMPYHERSLNTVLKELQFRCQKAGIKKCIEDDAKIFYKNISEATHFDGPRKDKKVITRGGNRKGLIAACVFYACNKKNETRSQKEIAEIFDINFTDVTTGCKLFNELLPAHIHVFSPSEAHHFLTRHCKKLKFTSEQLKDCIRITQNVAKLNLDTLHTTQSIAAVCITIISEKNKLNIERCQIADLFNISKNTIDKTYKSVEDYIKIILDDKLSTLVGNKLHNARVSMPVSKDLKERYENIGKLSKTGNTNVIVDFAIRDDKAEATYKLRKIMKTYVLGCCIKK